MRGMRSLEPWLWVLKTRRMLTVHVSCCSDGGFGRKSFPDFCTVEAAVLSPKKRENLSRGSGASEDDIKSTLYHSVAAMYRKAAAGGRPETPTAWLQRTVISSYRIDIRPHAPLIPTQCDNLGWASRMFRTPCQAFALRTGPQRHTQRIRLVPRSVANIYHAFGIQSFADELAHSGRQRSGGLFAAIAGSQDRVVPMERAPQRSSRITTEHTRHIRSIYVKISPCADPGQRKRAGWGKQKPGNGFVIGVWQCIAAS